MTQNDPTASNVTRSKLEERYQTASDELDSAVRHGSHDQELYWLGRKEELAALLDECPDDTEGDLR